MRDIHQMCVSAVYALGFLFLYITLYRYYYPETCDSIPSYKQQVEDLVMKQQYSLKTPDNSDEQRVFYNRVPKCGSGAMMSMITELKKRNRFNVFRSSDYYNLSISAIAEQAFVSMYEDLRPPNVYDRHVYFIDFTKYGYQQPIYFNVVREPLDLFLSLYYFDRFQPGHIRPMDEKDRALSFDDCVLHNNKYCTDPKEYFIAIPYFCGQESFCRTSGKESLALAMRNAQKYYWLVGLHDDYIGTLEAMELILPRFFKGARKVYAKKNETLWKDHGTVYKVPPGAEAVRVMKERLFHDYIFYNFVKSRFYEQLKRLRASQKNRKL